MPTSVWSAKIRQRLLLAIRLGEALLFSQPDPLKEQYRATRSGTRHTFERQAVRCSAEMRS